MLEQDALVVHIINYRKNNGLTQEQFAEGCSMSVDNISLIERKKIFPKLDTLGKIAGFMGVTVSELLAAPALSDLPK